MSDDPVLDAVDTIFKATPGHEEAIPIQAFVIAVGMGQDGGKWLSTFRSGDLRTWEIKGFLAEMKDTLAAVDVARMFEDD